MQFSSPRVDEVGASERANFFTKRSIKKESKLKLLYLALEMVDLTTLEGSDTVGKVNQMCAKAIHPAPPMLFSEMSKAPNFRDLPSVAAVCVYPSMVATALKALRGTKIQIASVATSFPSGQVPLNTKLLDVKVAVDAGATEIDMVINRGAFLSGNYQQVFDEIAATKEACGKAHLKVILETGELGTLDKVRLASDIAISAGGDFIKTSTGKVQPAATLPVTLVMLQAIADHHNKTGIKIGMKPAGGIRTAKQALQYLSMLHETLGSAWMTPDLFRFGASVLLNDLLKQIYKEYTGRYFYDKAFSLD
ncbi:MAG: 2-deoxyribose-5-phosphate aldolase [Proteobacteria bacterium SG_bin7]|nr:MAG: 2-deoxyribose-5-phosphate aldolase [Proteobacteria bacterium SG_bin7]